MRYFKIFVALAVALTATFTLNAQTEGGETHFLQWNNGLTVIKADTTYRALMFDTKTLEEEITEGKFRCLFRVDGDKDTLTYGDGTGCGWGMRVLPDTVKNGVVYFDYAHVTTCGFMEYVEFFEKADVTMSIVEVDADFNVKRQLLTLTGEDARRIMR